MTQEPRKVRRPPRFAPFLITGGVAGLLVGLLIGVLGHTDNRYDVTAELAFLALIFAALGLLIGGVVAVLLDKRS